MAKVAPVVEKSEIEPKSETVIYIPLDKIRPNPNNRKHFDPVKLQELADDIKARGVDSPIKVRPLAGEDGFFEIIFGERRWRASHMAGKLSIPSMVKDEDDQTAYESRLKENGQREDLNPLEEAEAFDEGFISGFYGSGNEAVQALAAKVNKSVSYVWGRLQLLKLIPTAREALEKGRITAGHADLIKRLGPEAQQKALDWLLPSGDGPAEYTVRPFKAWLVNSLHRYLRLAPFSLTDATLLKGACACVECPKRSHYQLFEGDVKPDGEDECLDDTCFRRKAATHIERTIKALQDGGATVYALSDMWSSSVVGQKYGLKLLYSGQWYSSTEPTGIVGVMVESHNETRIGCEVHVKLPQPVRPEDREAENKFLKAKGERAAKVGSLFRDALQTAVFERVQPSTDADFLRTLLTIHLLHVADDYDTPSAFKVLGLVPPPRPVQEEDDDEGLELEEEFEMPQDTLGFIREKLSAIPDADLPISFFKALLADDLDAENRWRGTDLLEAAAQVLGENPDALKAKIEDTIPSPKMEDFQSSKAKASAKPKGKKGKAPADAPTESEPPKPLEESPSPTISDAAEPVVEAAEEVSEELGDEEVAGLTDEEIEDLAKREGPDFLAFLDEEEATL